jgi:hypothetical protein
MSGGKITMVLLNGIKTKVLTTKALTAEGPWVMSNTHIGITAKAIPRIGFQRSSIASGKA